MSDYDVLEDYDSLESDLEFDEAFSALVEEDEAVRLAAPNVRRRPVRTGKGAGYYKSRPTSRYVTQAQLQAAMARVGKDVAANAVGIKSVGVRVDTVAAEQKKQTELLKREAAGRRKDLDKLKSSMQMAAILPLISTDTLTIPAGTVFKPGDQPLAEEKKVTVASSGMGMMLPLLLMGDGLGGGGDSSSMLLLALAFAK